MSRSADISVFNFRAAAAAAGTATAYRTVPQTFVFSGFAWMYESAEANTDNTLDFVLDYTEDGTNYTALHTNANAVGLLDTAAPLVGQVNKGDAASGGGAAVAVTPTPARVPKGAVLRCRITTAGTGTIPAVQLDALGYFV